MTEWSDPITFSAFDFAAAPPRERFDAMCETLRPFYEIGPHASATIEGKWSVWQLDSLLFSKSRFNNLKFEHAPKRLNQQDQEYLLVETYFTGRGVGMAGDRSTEHRPGAIQIVDMSRPFVNETSRVTTYGVLIPHAAVGYDPSRHAPFICLPTASPLGRVLFDAMMAQFRQLDHATQEDAPLLARRFAELVAALAISPREKDRSHAVHQARRLAIESFIDTQIGRPDFRVRDICAAFGISRASLYRLFPEEGGVASFNRNRRLACAAHDLASAPVTRGRVSAVAERWGFSDAGHLHRLIKRHYGETPSALAGSRLRAAAPATHAEVLGNWFRKISVMPNAETSVHGSQFGPHAIQDGK